MAEPENEGYGTEVRSPISRRGSAVGSGQPLSPGAQSDPSRGEARRDPVP